MTATATPTFDRIKCRVKDLQVTTVKKGERLKVETVSIDGRTMAPSPRFFTSLFAKYGFGESMFRWFDHHEVFSRISERAAADKLVATVEHNPDGTEKLLAVSAPNTVRVDHDELLGLLDKYGVNTDNTDYGHQYHRPGNRPSLPMSLLGRGLQNRDLITSSAGDGGARDIAQVPDVSYDTGVIRSIHTPRNVGDFLVAGDAFSNRFVMDVPIDGYGKPSIYLMLLREICTNGAIGYAKAFRSDLSLGKKEDSFEYALVRAFEGFNNEEGFQALRQRYESASTSWASIQEINKTYKALVRLHHKGEARVQHKYLTSERSGTDGAALMEGSPLIKSFHDLVGDLTRAYGLANLDALSMKRQRTLPAGCTVFELLNFVTEVATHHSTPPGARSMQALTGDFLSADYDLEGTVEKFHDWRDFLVLDKSAAESFQLAQQGKRS